MELDFARFLGQVLSAPFETFWSESDETVSFFFKVILINWGNFMKSQIN